MLILLLTTALVSVVADNGDEYYLCDAAGKACKKGQTCCKSDDDGKWACCKYSEAVCCGNSK